MATDHPDREVGAHGLEAEMLLGGEIERHPGGPAEPGEEIEEVDQRRDQHFARVLSRRRQDVELLLQPLLEHLRGDALVARAFLDADADPEHEQRRNDAEEVERAPSPERHDDERRERAQHVAERVTADEAAQGGRAPFGRRGLGDHQHADRVLAGERDPGDRAEDQEADPAGRKAGEAGEDRIAQDRPDQRGLATIEIGKHREERTCR